MAKLSSRPASLCYPSESATFADTNLREENYTPRKTPRRRRSSSEVGDVPSTKEQNPLYPKIHIPIRNPGI